MSELVLTPRFERAFRRLIGKNPFSIGLRCLFLLFIPLVAHAQVNSGSNGSDGAFNPTTNTLVKTPVI